MPDISITPRAKEALKTTITKESSGSFAKDLVPAILWMSDSPNLQRGYWAIGFYERSRTKPEWIVYVDGLAFYLDPADRDRLTGHIVDYIDGSFQIHQLNSTSR